jgi:hypothetical protein
MIFAQNRGSERFWSDIDPAVGVTIAAQRRFRATQPLDFQALRALLGQAPSSNFADGLSAKKHQQRIFSLNESFTIEGAAEALSR